LNNARNNLKTSTTTTTTPTNSNESSISFDALPTVQERIEQFQSISRQFNSNVSKPNSVQTTPQQLQQVSSSNKGQLMFNKLNNSINSDHQHVNNTNSNSKDSSPRIVRILAATPTNQEQRTINNQSPQAIIKFNKSKQFFKLYLPFFFCLI
jgi:pyruvate carboxylase